MFGVMRDCLNRFKVSSAGSRSWHQSDSGNLSSTPASIEIKCALNVIKDQIIMLKEKKHYIALFIKNKE